MSNQAYIVKVEIAGDTAMWSRPDTGDSPVSYPAPTFSAVKAIFESILWGPDVEIVPLKAEICMPIKYYSYCTNYGGPLRQSESIKRGNNYQLFATVLIDVSYRLYAEIFPYKDKSRLPENAIKWDKKTTSPGHAYKDIFQRRLERGQCYSIPYLGWKEFTPSYFGNFRSSSHVLSNMPTITIASMLREVFPKGYDSKVSYKYDTEVVIENGVLNYE